MFTNLNIYTSQPTSVVSSNTALMFNSSDSSSEQLALKWVKYIGDLRGNPTFALHHQGKYV